MKQLLLLVFLLTLHTQSDAKNLCICDVISDGDPVARLALKAGCKFLQINKQCDAQIVMRPSENESYVSLDRLMAVLRGNVEPNDTIKITYVGHWHTAKTIDYINAVLLPLATIYQANVEHQNTGCSAMGNPEAVQDHLSVLKSQIKTSITIEGNQSTSIGAGSLYFANGVDLTARASTDWKSPKYKLCENIVGSKCAAEFQLGGRREVLRSEET